MKRKKGYDSLFFSNRNLLYVEIAQQHYINS